jgi:xanthine dehydrogenase accessory factor
VTVDILRLAGELSDAREPFVMATVVWRRAPSSGKAGSRAVITAEGKVRGWLGGACAEPVVVRESRSALEEGTPRLVFLGAPDELEERAREGVVTAPIACQSEGAMEVFLEPMIPSPHLVVVGRSPMADTLSQMATALGWDPVVVDDRGSASDHPGVAHVVAELDLGAAGVGAGSFVVVATQGHYDESALQAALDTPAAYIGLVASRKRAESVVGYLRQQGVDEASLNRIRAPAGLDLGAVSHVEIAVAILAELVQLKAAGELDAGTSPPPRPEEATDPVCGMRVEVSSARYTATREGVTYYFCSAGCLQSFESEPAR